MVMVMDRGKPSVLYLRVAPQLQHALKRVADAAGLSVTAYAVHILAAAVGAELYADGPVGASGVQAIPDSMPITADDHRRARNIAIWQERIAKTRWWERNSKIENAGYIYRRMTPEDFVDWFRREALADEEDPSRFTFTRNR